MVDSAASYAGALLTPVSVFIAVPVALRQLGEADAGKFLVIVSFSRLISGFDLGIAQLATPRLRSFESHSQSRRKFCVSSVLALGCISVIGAALMSLIFSLSSGAILKSVNFHDVIALMCLAFGFSLATFAREFSGAVKQYRSAFVISSTASVIYLSLILKFMNGIGPELGLIVAGYLITQSIAILVVSSLKSRDQSAAINGSNPRFSWRTAVTI